MSCIHLGYVFLKSSIVVCYNMNKLRVTYLLNLCYGEVG